MKNQRPNPAAGFLLDSEQAGSLQVSVNRLRLGGLSATEAAAELVRQNVYDWLDAEPDVTRYGPIPRLRRRKTSA